MANDSEKKMAQGKQLPCIGNHQYLLLRTEIISLDLRELIKKFLYMTDEDSLQTVRDRLVVYSSITSLVDVFNRADRLPLIDVARVGNVDLAKILVEFGAGINTWSDEGWTALHTAVGNRRFAFISYLLDCGVDHERHEQESPPWMIRKYDWFRDYVILWDFMKDRGYGFSDLMDAGKKTPNRLETVEDIFERHPSPDVLTGFEDRRNLLPIQIAAINGDVELAKMLLEYRHTDHAVYGALNLAVAFGHRGFVELLFEKALGRPRVADVVKGSYKKMGDELRAERSRKSLPELTGLDFWGTDPDCSSQFLMLCGSYIRGTKRSERMLWELEV